MNTNKKIGFIGLGIMGQSMASNILKAGHSLFVYNRTKAKSKTLVDAGASLASSPAELVSNVEICCTCVTNEKVIFDIIEGLSDLGSYPKYWIDFSTVSPSSVTELSNKLLDLGITFIDAPISGGDVGARNGTLSIMVGATPSEFSEVLPLFEILGKNITNVGPLGAGQLTKCVNQLIVAVTILAMSEGIYFAEKSGLNLQTTLNVVSSGAAGSWALDNYAPRLLKGEYGPGFYAKDMLKDLRFVLEKAEELKLNLPGLKLVEGMFNNFVNGVGADLGNHALIKQYIQIDEEKK